MDPSKQSYDQPEKRLVRERIIAHAVQALGEKREESSVVTVREFEKTIEYCLAHLHEDYPSLSRDLQPHLENWFSLHRSRVGRKTAEDLTVLFLAGPSPWDDLREFRRHGILSQNARRGGCAWPLAQRVRRASSELSSRP